MISNDRQAVILSAGLGTRIAIAAMGRPKAMTVAGARPAFVAQIQQLVKAGVRRVVVVHAPGDERQFRRLTGHVFARAEIEFALVEQRCPQGPLDALVCAAEELMAGDVMLLLGDTLVADIGTLPPDSVGIAHVADVREFCIASVNAAGQIRSYADKPDHQGPSDYALVGVYRFADAGLLRDLLRSSHPSVSSELSDVLSRYGALRPMTAVSVTGWQDLGTYQRYIVANRSSLRGRRGHSFEVIDDGSVVKSGKRSVMAAQARWYRDLPDFAVGLAPRLLDNGDGWYRVELLDYPNLAQLLLFEDQNPETWRFLLTRLIEVVEARLWGPTRRADDALPMWCERKYITKTEQRLTKWPLWGRLRTQRMVINDVEVPSFAELWPTAVGALRGMAAGGQSSCLIHGDMTFSNILLARNFGIFKLLDPGTTFSNSPGGDVRYDLAKLRQSYASGYDALSEDLFAVDQVGQWSWELRMYPEGSPISTVGDEVLAGAGYDLAEIRLLEAIQFLSMVPIHLDNPLRQLALYVRGLDLLAQVLKGHSYALARV